MNLRAGCANCASSLAILDWRPQPTTPGRDAFRIGLPGGDGFPAKHAPMSASLRGGPAEEWARGPVVDDQVDWQKGVPCSDWQDVHRSRRELRSLSQPRKALGRRNKDRVGTMGASARRRLVAGQGVSATGRLARNDSRPYSVIAHP